MDDFKKKIKIKQIMLVTGLLCACGLILFSRSNVKDSSIPEYLQGLNSGFQVGITLALFGFLISSIVKNIMAIRNPERLRKLYISETDERKLLIMQKSGSAGMNVIMYGLSVGAAVAGNINDTVFFTLLGACIFVVTVRGFLKLYYRKIF